MDAILILIIITKGHISYMPTFSYEIEGALCKDARVGGNGESRSGTPARA